MSKIIGEKEKMANVITRSELDDIFELITRIIISELKKYSLKSSYIAILGYSKGVKGDKGLHGLTVAFNTVNQKGEKVLDIEWSLLKKIERRIVGEIQLVSRVLYEIPHE